MFTLNPSVKDIVTNFSQFKTNFLHSKLFQSGQNSHPPFQTVLDRPKPTLSISSRSSWAETDFFHSKTVRPKPISSSPSYSSQDKTDFLHSIPSLSMPKPTFSTPSHSSQSNIVNKFSLLSLPCCSWSPNYSVLVYINVL
jgi:hypothetical protein